MSSRQALEFILRRLRSLVGRGSVTIVDDRGPIQIAQVQINDAQVIDEMPVMGQYGLQCNPPANSDALLIFLNGEQTVGVVVGTNTQASRKRGLEPGEVGLFDDQGQEIHLKRSGIVITAPLGVTVNGDTVFNGAVTANGHRIDESHKHSGVQAGAANTGTVT